MSYNRGVPCGSKAWCEEQKEWFLPQSAPPRQQILIWTEKQMWKPLCRGKSGKQAPSNRKSCEFHAITFKKVSLWVEFICMFIISSESVFSFYYILKKVISHKYSKANSYLQSFHNLNVFFYLLAQVFLRYFNTWKTCVYH